jgi:AraC family transcriptional regulator, regulatory protein of adaptative response / DNA-3-methyladenine glycosylase II
VIRGTMGRVRLTFRPPYAAESLVTWLGGHLVGGLEALDGTTYRRVLPGHRVVALDITEAALTLTPQVDDPSTWTDTVERCRQMLDADADPLVVDAALARDPVLAPLVRARPGLRVPGAPDGFELLVRTVLAQQVSLASAHTFARRVVAAYGVPLDTPVGSLTAGFPTAEVLAEASYDGIGLTGARVRTVRAAAAAYAAGDLTLDPSADRGRTRAQLLALPGVGPWTVDYVAMRALGDPDVFPGTDLILKRRAAALDPEQWAPWRSYAAMHLWLDHLARAT